MTPEQIEGNKLIAEFRGYKNLHSPNWYVGYGRGFYIDDPICYHSSWDLLMPVIEQIESLPTDKESGSQFQFNITGDGISITQFDDGSGIIEQRANEIGKSKLKHSFEVVVEFIKWYNQIIKP